MITPLQEIRCPYNVRKISVQIPGMYNVDIIGRLSVDTFFSPTDIAADIRHGHPLVILRMSTQMSITYDFWISYGCKLRMPMDALLSTLFSVLRMSAQISITITNGSCVDIAARWQSLAAQARLSPLAVGTLNFL